MSLGISASYHKRKVTPSPPRGLDITVAKVSARVGFVYLFLKSAIPLATYFIIIGQCWTVQCHICHPKGCYYSS